MNLPEGFELEEPLKLQNQIKLPEGFELEKPLAKQEPAAAPIQPEQPESFSTLRHVADIPLKTTQGLISGVKMISDAFGANNPISKNLDSAGNYIADLMSAQAKNDSAKVQEILKEAQDKGVYDQLKSGIQAFSVAPVGMLANALGTAAPAIIAALGSEVLGPAAFLTSAGIGATMGAGSLKGSIYDAVKEELSKTQMPPDQIEARAQLAQNYNGKNLDMILAGAAFGTLGATTGVESSVARQAAKSILSKTAIKGEAENIIEQKAKEVAEKQLQEAAKRGVVKQGAISGATEFGTEFAQSAQENLGQNLALQREGVDVPLTRGVFGQAALEGLAGLGMGSVTGGFEARGAKNTLQAREQQKTVIEDQLKKEQANADAVAMEHFGLNTEELNKTLSEPKKEPIYDVPKQEATDYLAQLDANEKKPSFPALQKHIKALGLEMPESGPNRNQRAIELLRNHLAPQGEQNVGDNIVAGTDTTSTPVSQQEGVDTATKGTPGIIPGSMVGTDTTQGQLRDGEEVQRAALEKQAADEAKQKAALEQQAIENETVEKKSIKELEAAKKEQKDVSEKPATQNYLEATNYYGNEAPKDVNTAIKNAAHEQAFDTYDTVAQKQGVDRELKNIADQKNIKQQAKRDQMRQELTGKVNEETNRPYTKQKINSLVSNIPLYDAGKPLDFLSPEELTDLHLKYAGKKQIESGERTTRQEHANLRNAFIATLTPEQKENLNAISKQALTQEILARETRAGQVAESNKYKERADRIAKTTEEVSKSLAAIEKQKAEEREKTSQEIATKEKEEEKQIEKDLNEFNQAAEKLLPKKETTTKQPSKLSKLTKTLIDNIKNNDILTAIENISDSTLNDRATRTNAKAFTQLIKLFGGITNKDLKIEFGVVENNNPGKFNPATNTITIQGNTKEGYTGTRSLDEVVMHEVGHYLNDHVIDNRKAYLASIKNEADRKAVENALNRLTNNYNYVKNKLGKKYNIQTIKEFIAEFWGNSAFQLDLRTIDIEKEGQYVPVGPIKTYKTKEENKNLFQRIIGNIAEALGLGQNNKPGESIVFKELLEDLSRIAALPTADIRGKEISFSRTTPPKQAPYLNVTSAYDENPAFAVPDNLQNSRVKNVSKQFFTNKNIQNTVRVIQNKARFMANLENTLTRAKLLKDSGEGQNNYFAQYTLWSGRAQNIHNEEVADNLKDLLVASTDFAKTDEIIEATKKANIARKKKDPNAKELSTIDFAQGVLHIYAQAFTDVERRLNMFVQTAPLDKTNKVVPWQGKLISVADFRETLLGNQNLNKPGLFDTDINLTEDKARELWLQLESYVFTKSPDGKKIPNTQYVIPTGFSPDGRVATDFRTADGNAQYNVTGLTYQETEKILAQYNSDKNKALLDKILNATYKLNETAKNSNKSSNYMSKPAANWVAAYGYEKYVPLKGITAHTPTARRVGLEFNGKALETELVQAAIKSEGRFSVSNNPILQSMNDVMISTVRAGKGPAYTQTIKNLIEQKHINGKVLETIKFPDRSADKIKSLRRDNTIFHHNKDGSIDVLEINDKNILESIRIPFEKSNIFVEMANSLTSALGQFHTRYNVNFAPVNFTRDTLTNAWTMGAQFGPVVAAQLVQQISAQVATKNSLGKAFNFARTYKKSGFNEKYKNSTDPVERNMYELIIKGGMVEYMEGISIRSNLEKLNKELGRNKILKGKDQLDKVVDVWTNMFELASRSAAYGVIKQHYMNKEKLSNEDASERAAAYVKNLANFEQVGTEGKLLGALFMFFRPSATGAVRALDALAPAMPYSLEKAISNLPQNIKEDPEALKNYTENYKSHQKSARIMSIGLMGLGVLAYTMSYMMADTDDMDRNKVLTDDMGQWTRFWRIHIPGFDKPFQIPWGFGLGAFASMGAQLAAAVSGQQSLGAAMKNGATQIALDSFVPIPISRMDIADNPAMWAVDSITPSVIKPVIEFVANKNGLGQNIYNDATGRKLGDAYLGGSNIPESYKIAARYISEVTYGEYDWTPNSLYFLANSYIDGPSRLIDYALNSYYLATGYKEFDAKTDIPFLGSLIGTAPNIDAKQFTSIENKIQDITGKVNQFKKFNPEYYYTEYLEKYPMNEMIVDIYNHSLPPLNQLRAEEKMIRGSKYDLATRKQLLDMNREQQNIIKYNLVEMFKAYGVEP